MIVLIFGSSSVSGRQLVPQAKEQQLQVTAFVRDPITLKQTHDNLRVVQDSVLRPTGLTNGKAASGYKIALSFANAKIKGRILRADVAPFMFRQLTTDAIVGRAVEIS